MAAHQQGFPLTTEYSQKTLGLTSPSSRRSQQRLTWTPGTTSPIVRRFREEQEGLLQRVKEEQAVRERPGPFRAAYTYSGLRAAHDGPDLRDYSPSPPDTPEPEDVGPEKAVMTFRKAAGIAWKSSENTFSSVHSTISKDNTNGESARRAKLFADFGRKLGSTCSFGQNSSDDSDDATTQFVADDAEDSLSLSPATIWRDLSYDDLRYSASPLDPDYFQVLKTVKMTLSYSSSNPGGRNLLRHHPGGYRQTPGKDINEFRKGLRPREDIDDAKSRRRLEQPDRSIFGHLRDITPASIISSNEPTSVGKDGMLQLSGIR